MERTGRGCFSIARLAAIVVMLLLIPLAAFAAGVGSMAHTDASPGLLGDHHASILPDTTEVHGAPAEEPLHCHLRTAHPQECGLAVAMTKDDLPTDALHDISVFALETKVHMPIVWARVPIPERSRFILFGNFRS